MKSIALRHPSSFLLLAALLAAGSLQAQDTMPAPAQSAGMPMHGHHGDMMKNMQGMHAMPATVTAADPKTGIVDVTAGGMALKVHFPPGAMASLKAGDKITVHMGYSKP